ncbi:hypothetical protein EBR66_07360, partial [bacterium]|nr:hypothetical protein [bacterium]
MKRRAAKSRMQPLFFIAAIIAVGLYIWNDRYTGGRKEGFFYTIDDDMQAAAAAAQKGIMNLIPGVQ